MTSDEYAAIGRRVANPPTAGGNLEWEACVIAADRAALWELHNEMKRILRRLADLCEEESPAVVAADAAALLESLGGTDG